MEATEEAPAREALPTESLRGSETVLVVESDDLVRRIVVRVLTDLGYRVLQAASGAEALIECGESDTVDVVLTDMLVSDMSGDEVIDRVRAIRPDAKVIRMSGYAPGEIARRGVSHSSAPLLRKPFTPDEIAHAVRQALDARGRR
jgi:CheY-like chemotaxis protein